MAPDPVYSPKKFEANFSVVDGQLVYRDSYPDYVRVYFMDTAPIDGEYDLNEGDIWYHQATRELTVWNPLTAQWEAPVTSATSPAQPQIDALNADVADLQSSVYDTDLRVTDAEDSITALSARTDAVSARADEVLSLAATDATSKANAAQANAEAGSHAYTDSSVSGALSTASADATSKANAAQSAAISAAASDATTKANAAQTAAISTAEAYTDSELNSGPWTGYTPSLSGFTLGNGSLDAAYRRVGSTVFVRFTYTAGSTSSFTPSATFIVTLPVAPVSLPTGFPIGQAFFLDSSAGSVSRLAGTINAISGGSTAFFVTAKDTAATVTTAAPWTWAAGDQIMFTAVYEAA